MRKAGLQGKVIVSGRNICVKGWTFKGSVQSIDQTSGCDSGFVYPVGGNRKGTGTFNAVYDDADLPTTGGTPIVEGLDGVTFVGWLSALGSGGGVNCPKVLITEVNWGVTIGGEVAHSCNFETQGPYSYT